MALEGIEDLSQETQNLLDGNHTKEELKKIDENLEYFGKILEKKGKNTEEIKKILEEIIINSYHYKTPEPNFKGLNISSYNFKKANKINNGKESIPGEKDVTNYNEAFGISLDTGKLSPGANISYTNSKGEEIIVSNKEELEEFISVSNLSKKDEKEARKYFDLYIDDNEDYNY